MPGQEVQVSTDHLQPLSVNVYKGAEKTTPDYFRAFLEANASTLSMALKDGNQDALKRLLQQFSRILPKDVSFREIAALVGRQRNGDIIVTTVEGDIHRINSQKAGDLLDEAVKAFPVEDTEQFLFVHTHPPELDPLFGAAISAMEVGFSDPDKKFLITLGTRLKAYHELQRVYAGLATANTDLIVLNEGRNQGLAYGWQFNP